jgi:hypothetical protein
MDTKGSVDRVISAGTRYARSAKKYFRLSITAQAVDSLAGFLSASVIILIAAVAVLFCSLGLAFYLSEVFRSFKWGFLCVGGIYFIVFLVILSLRHKMRNALKKSAIRALDSGYEDYESFREDMVLSKAEVDSAESAFNQELLVLRSRVNKIETGLGYTGEEGAKVDAKSAMLTGAVDLLLNTFVSRNAGAVGKIVVPAVAKAIMNSGLVSRVGKSRFFQNIKRRSGKWFG